MYICRLPLFVSRCDEDFILASWLFGQLLIDDVLAEILPDRYNLSSGKAIKVVFAVVLYEESLGLFSMGCPQHWIRVALTLLRKRILWLAMETLHTNTLWNVTYSTSDQCVPKKSFTQCSNLDNWLRGPRKLVWPGDIQSRYQFK